MSPVTCRVFISYAHDTPAHEEEVYKYANWLNNPGGLACWIDQYVEDAEMPRGWPHWMREQIKEAKYVLVICSPRFKARYDNDAAEEGKGLGAKFESTLILNDFYQEQSRNVKFIPIILKPDHQAHIVDFLQSYTYYDLSNPKRRDALYKKLTGQIKSKPETSDNMIDFSGQSDPNKVEVIGEILSDVPLPVIQNLISMKPGTKILQAFFGLSAIKRFVIATELGLVEKGEELQPDNSDKLSAIFLERALTKNLLADLWSKLFDENIDPNPFKNK